MPEQSINVNLLYLHLLEAAMLVISITLDTGESVGGFIALRSGGLLPREGIVRRKMAAL